MTKTLKALQRCLNKTKTNKQTEYQCNDYDTSPNETKYYLLFMHTSKAILNLPTSSLHLCSPFQQNRKVKIHHQFTSFPKQLGQDSPPRI